MGVKQWVIAENHVKSYHTIYFLSTFIRKKQEKDLTQRAQRSERRGHREARSRNGRRPAADSRGFPLIRRDRNRRRRRKRGWIERKAKSPHTRPRIWAPAASKDEKEAEELKVEGSRTKIPTRKTGVWGTAKNRKKI